MFFRYYSLTPSQGFGWGGGALVSMSVVERNQRHVSNYTPNATFYGASEKLIMINHERKTLLRSSIGLAKLLIFNVVDMYIKYLLMVNHMVFILQYLYIFRHEQFWIGGL